MADVFTSYHWPPAKLKTCCPDDSVIKNNRHRVANWSKVISEVYFSILLSMIVAYRCGSL